MVKIITKEIWQKSLVARHGNDLQKKFSNATVAICGLGGLGSNIAISLARVGIGRLILIDFDKVDTTNLHRQQYKASQVGKYKTEALYENIKEVSPFIEAEIKTTKITIENMHKLLYEADIVCEAFDEPEAKAMLANTILEIFPEKYYIAASGMAGISSANAIKTRKVMNKFYLCGDETSDVKNNIGLLSTRVMLCASHQAHMVLRILAGELEA